MLTPDQKANLRMFVDALRSGDYEQTIGRLRANGCFCALGVACDVAKKRGGVSLEWRDDRCIDLCAQQTVDVYLPKSVQAFYGLSGLGQLPNGSSISQLNDDGFDFNYIAESIERGLLSATA